MYFLEPTLSLLGDNANVRSQKKPKFAAKYGLHHTWEHTCPIRNDSHVHDVHVPRFQDSNERREWQHLLHAIYFVNKCEATFSTERLKISKCTWIKFLLDTNLASSVKPSNNSWHNVSVLVIYIECEEVGKCTYFNFTVNDRLSTTSLPEITK